MYLARFWNSIIKEDGFIIEDANGKKYIIGSPKKKKSITLRLLEKSLNYKLLFHPDLYLGEAYTNGKVIIENGTLTEFLNIVLINISRNQINIFSKLINKVKGSYRYLTKFNFANKSKKKC